MRFLRRGGQRAFGDVLNTAVNGEGDVAPGQCLIGYCAGESSLFDIRDYGPLAGVALELFVQVLLDARVAPLLKIDAPNDVRS